jgi:predicted NBD/HSP70 family sugar kinase
MARVRAAVERGDQTALAEWYGRPSRLTPEDVVLAAHQGDAVARSALKETGEALGLGIANAVQLLNPSLVALTGKFCNTAGDFLLEAVKCVISSRCFEAVSRKLEIRVAPLRKDVGAGWLRLDGYGRRRWGLVAACAIRTGRLSREFSEASLDRKLHDTRRRRSGCDYAKRARGNLCPGIRQVRPVK